MLTNLSIVARTGIKSTKLPSKLNFIVICRVRTNSVEVRFSDDLLVLGLCSKSGDLINRRYRCIYIYIRSRSGYGRECRHYTFTVANISGSDSGSRGFAGNVFVARNRRSRRTFA